jgi:predicted lipoprotein with Yx(FWY)xxD motif
MRSGSRARFTAVAVLALAVAMLLGACGGGGGGGYGDRRGGGTTEAAETTAAPNPEEGATFVSLASVPGLGLILVDSAGRTLYAFSADGGGEPSCYGGCAEAWPPLLTEGEPFAGNGAAPARLGTAERRDGTVQVTYAGQPLYAFDGDKSPGEANGNGKTADGGTWAALAANGDPAS